MRVLSLCITLSICATVLAQVPGRPGPAPRRKALQAKKTRAQRTAQRTRQLVHDLNRMVPEVTFDADSLDTVFDWLVDQGVGNLVVDWRAIENTTTVDRSTPVTLRLSQVTVGEVINVVLEQVSSAAPTDDERLTYIIADGIMRVSIRETFAREMFTRKYYVEDLLFTKTANELQPFIRVGSEFSYVRTLQPVVASGAAAMAPDVDVIDTGTHFGPGGPEYGVPEFTEMRDRELASLIDLLESIRPDTWVSGGGRGTIRPFGEYLVITQSIEMHEMIGGAFRKSPQ